MVLTRLLLLYFVSFLLVIDAHAQKENSFSAGLMFSPTVSASTLIHNSASVFIHSLKNGYLLGLDFYLNKIRGIGGGYQHHFLTDKKKNHWYAELNLRYVKYASGYAEDGPVDYFNPSSICDDQMVNENSVATGSLSFGREFFLSRMFYFNLSVGGGAYRRKKELLDCWKSVYRNSGADAIHLEAVLKVGIGIVAYRK